jgi:hypothetical protein
MWGEICSTKCGIASVESVHNKKIEWKIIKYNQDW